MLNAEKIAELLGQVLQEMEDGGMTARVDMVCDQKLNVHMTDEAFVELFGQGKLRRRDCLEYPYEHYADVDGVRFFAIGEETL